MDDGLRIRVEHPKGSRDVVEVLRRAIGEHYDVRDEGVTSHVVKGLYESPPGVFIDAERLMPSQVIAVYERGSGELKLRLYSWIL